MVVEDVIGYAQAPWVMCVSTQVTIPAPSEVVGMPGKGTRTSRSRKAFPVRGVAPWTTVLIVALPKKSDLETYENFWATQIYEDSVSDSAAHGKGHAVTFAWSEIAP